MKKYTKDELEFIKNPPKELEKPNISKNTLEIMKKRSFLKNEKGDFLEGPKEMFWRVAASFALEERKNGFSMLEINKKAKEFYDLMSRNKFLPGARVLYEAGNYIDGTGQLASCFVLPVEDGLDSIFQTMKEAAIVQKNNGGTGFNFSHIRPKGDSVGGTPNVAAGPIHFIRSYSQSFDHILQGKKRGGGNMGILNVNHPDILDFIDLKSGESVIRNFNLSVGITDIFMNAVKNDEEYELINPRNDEVVDKLRARDVFDKICQSAWECADPGLFFLDTAQRANPTPEIGVIEATNPCGEEPLRAYESCNLGSIVLPSHLDSKGQIDWDKLKDSTHKAINILDNMIDLSVYPLEKIKREVEKTRKLGLGLVGLATLFFEMKIPYNSDEAIDLTTKIMKFVQEEAEKASITLAKNRGTFPGFKNSKWEKEGKKVRNATMSSIAPTGTLSLIANTSSGIEPVFSLVYKYRGFYQDDGKEDHKQLLYVNEQFEAYAKKHKFYSKELMEKIAENNGSLAGLDEVPDEAKKIFVTTHDVSPEWHVKIQSAAQKFVDAAVSKTINLPNDATVEDVRKSYIQAWETGCKGITIYRDGSKQMQVLENSTDKKQVESVKKEESEFKYTDTYELTPNAYQVLEKRALKKDDNGNVIETPDELWKRIARYVAGAETKYDGRKARRYEKEFFEIMNSGEFLSGGTLIYAGLGTDSVMSKCLVLPIDDSIDSIFGALNQNIQMLRRGVGTGFNFSKIRSTYAIVKTTGEKAAGPIEYLKMFNRAQDTIKGRGGRGLGSMAILNVDHPNIEHFIRVKDDLEGLSHYNISVGITNKYMKAVKEDQEWELIDPHSREVCKTIKARELFQKIAEHAWLSGDPGMFFIDTAEKGNTTPELGKMDSTNPCGEQPLIPYETCNLGNIDVSKFIKGFPYLENPKIRDMDLPEKLKTIDWERLEQVTKLGVRFLDNIIDINNYPIREIEEMTTRTRNVGLGVMGYADFLIKLGISYKSNEAEIAAEKIMKFIQQKAHEASEELGEEKGNFPEFENSIWAQNPKIKFMRNTRTTTIAPTGSVSIIANCNPGIEPIFALGYRRKNSMGGADQEVIEHLFESIAKERGFHSEELIKDIANGKHLSEIKDKYNIPDDVIDIFVTTHEIEPAQHVKIQAAFQKYVDSAVSKTINLPASATWRDIAKVYELAFDLGCKGITVFRDGSKDAALQVGTAEKKKEIVQVKEESRQIRTPKERPDVVKGFTYKIETNQGRLFVTINEDEVGPFEIFLQGVGKSGSFTSGFMEAVGRLVSLGLRSGIETDEIIKQLLGIRSGQPTMNKGGVFVYSVPDAVAKIIKRHMNERKEQLKMFEKSKDEKTEEIEEMAADDAVIAETIAPTKPVIEASSKYTTKNMTGDLMECPECGGDLEYAEGCILCRGCGFSKCG
ncbi:adenosylcobalamin-dependent ribonucleoside-diphosphate reductase [Candidatus Dojkabacteria bacterium]|nr:adenosylcobalamin-dependent ribonucleoside-diphosphate reductase [Candidatus Dojkabacteria bacterium]